MKLCAVEDCERPHNCKGFCRTHYHRFAKHGDPSIVLPKGKRPPPTVETFWSRVEKTDGCWLWTGAKHDDGYGRQWWQGRNRPAHRLAYEFEVGPIGPGLDIDHLCRTPSCVRPDHLEPVTRKENLRRGIGAEVTRQRHAARRAATQTGGQ